jgi:hypothetical protein
MVQFRLFALALVVAGVAATAACKRKEGAIDGIGPYHLGKTVASEGTICQPQEGDLTWCSHNQELTVAGHRATVDLYFRGHEPTAPLSEILLAIRPPCDVEAIDAWLAERLGQATRSQGKAIVWQGPAAHIAALLPAEGGECRIHFVDPKDAARLTAIEKEAAGGAP